MDFKILIFALILAIFSAASVLIVRDFVAKNIYNFKTISLFIIEILIVTIIVIGGYFYFILNKISMARFYPLVKIIELCIPVIAAILIYRAKMHPINYIGIF